MRFLNGTAPEHDLTYSDVFMVPEPVGRRLAAGRGPGHHRRQRRHHPDRDGQHDRGLRAADGGDRRAARRPGHLAAGHPGRRGGRRDRLGQVPGSGGGDRADAGADRYRGRRAEPAAQAGAQRGGGGRGRAAGRRGHRGRLPGRGPVHPAEPRDVGRPVHAARRDAARAGVLAAARGTAPAGAGGGRRRPLPGHHDPDRGAARHAVLPRRRRLGTAAGRRRASA